MDKDYYYEGYVIMAAPYHLASGEWDINIRIRRDTHSFSDTIWGPFIAKNTFKTEEEAIQQCIEFGRQIIDGKIDNCSVSK